MSCFEGSVIQFPVLSRFIKVNFTSRRSILLRASTGPQLGSSPSNMEALGGYPTRSSNPKAKKLTVLLSMTIGVGCLFLLQTQLLKPRRPPDFYSFEVKDAKGRTVSLEKYRGKVGPHHHHQLARQHQKLPQLCRSQLNSLEFTLEDAKSAFTMLFVPF